MHGCLDACVSPTVSRSALLAPGSFCHAIQELRLGAQKLAGFGKVIFISVKVQFYMYKAAIL